MIRLDYRRTRMWDQSVRRRVIGKSSGLLLSLTEPRCARGKDSSKGTFDCSQHHRCSAMKKIRRRISSELKAKIALEAMQGRYTASDIAERYGVHPNQVYLWKKQLRDRAAAAFDPLIVHFERPLRPK
jgi:hypothetical protein